MVTRPSGSILPHECAKRRLGLVGMGYLADFRPVGVYSFQMHRGSPRALSAPPPRVGPHNLLYPWAVHRGEQRKGYEIERAGWE